MPIYVSDYTWHQTIQRIMLSLDLHKTSPKNVDIIATSSYLKVSFLPYIFEAFLSHTVIVDQSTARIIQGRVEFDLVKDVQSEWDALCYKLSKEEMQTRRQEAIKDFEEQEKKKEKQKKEERIQRERLSVSHQISKDDQLREERSKLIEREKEEFLKLSSKDMLKGQPHDNFLGADNSLKVELRRRVSSTCSEDSTTLAQEMDYDGDGEDSIYYSSTENLHLKNTGFEIKAEKADRKQRKSSTIRKADHKEKEEKKKEERKKSTSVLPAVRQSRCIKVKYTPRVFPTPRRESTQDEEQQWLAAQQSSQSSTLGDQATKCSETYYRDKAVSLFGNGDYCGCVNAYTEALKLNPAAPSLYSNRAAANLVLSNLHHTVNDCSKALELLTPPSQDNSKSRLLCHIRRGTALVRLGLPSEGLADYQAAQQLDPDNKSLTKDVERIQAMLTTSSDSGDSDVEENDSGCDDSDDGGGNNGGSTHSPE